MNIGRMNLIAQMVESMEIGLQAVVQEVQKNNGNIYALVVGNGEIRPAIYFESFDTDLPDEVLAREMYDTYRQAIANTFGYEQEEVKRLIRPDRIIAQLINTEKNTERLKGIPSITCCDLSLIFRIKVNENEEGMSTMIVNNDVANYLGMTTSEMLVAATLNENISIRTIEEMVLSMIPEEMREQFEKEMDMNNENNIPVYVVTNEKGINGAWCTFGCIGQVADKIGDNVYIFPSSIHEMIVVPASIGDVNDFRSLVREVNATTVSAEDFLSDNVYHYDRATQKVTIV